MGLGWEVVRYCGAALYAAAYELALSLGGIFLLAIALYSVSMRLRLAGSSILGRAYYWLVAPGVMCHETGHALGCVLTWTRVVKFVPFHPSGNTLGYVTHETHGGLRGAFSEFVIATGPVWFGCALVYACGMFLAGGDFAPSYARTFPQGLPDSAWGYCSGVISASVQMVRALGHLGQGPLWLNLLLLYFFFCVASEITLSGVDLKSMRGALAALIPGVILLNFIPGVSAYLVAGVDSLAPVVFVVHAILFFVLGVDLLFMLALLALSSIFSR